MNPVLPEPEGRVNLSFLHPWDTLRALLGDKICAKLCISTCVSHAMLMHRLLSCGSCLLRAVRCAVACLFIVGSCLSFVAPMLFSGLAEKVRQNA